MNQEEDTRLAHLFEHQEEFEDKKLKDEIIRIGKLSGQLNVPSMDIHKVKTLIDQQIQNEHQNPTRRSIYKLIVSAAAVLILLVGYFFLFEAKTEIHTMHGQQMVHELPDHSKVHLNADSKIAYDKNFEERILNLEGEAFFEVEKGSKFVVKTDNGAVTVLGTSFNVFSMEGFFVVSCKTGTVAVSIADKQVILNPNQQIRLESKEQFSEVELVNPANIGNWNSGQSYFTSTPLKTVVASLLRMYDVKIDLPSKYENETFTGSFVNDDIEKALKMVFSPMNINYIISNDTVIEIVE